MITKKIVCLANSRRMSERCIAGKEILNKSNFGDWIRPISRRVTGSISDKERQYESGEMCELLDIILIPMLKPKPNRTQPENYVIDDKYYWEKTGKISIISLPMLCDKQRKTLWINNFSSYYGNNDRVPIEDAENQGYSLVFICTNNLLIKVVTEGQEFDNPRRKVRASFRYNDVGYKLAVTDPIIEQHYFKKKDGTYRIQKKVFMCVSLGEVHEG